MRHRFLDVRDAAAGRLGREAPGEPARERRPGAEQCREREPAETTRYERRDPLARPGSVGTEGQPVPASDQTRDPAGHRRAHGRARIERGWPLAGRVCHAPLRPSLRPPRTRRSRAVISGGVHGMRGPGGPAGPSAMRTSRNAGPSRVEESGQHRVELARASPRAPSSDSRRRAPSPRAATRSEMVGCPPVDACAELSKQTCSRFAAPRPRSWRARPGSSARCRRRRRRCTRRSGRASATPEADRRGQAHRADHVEAARRCRARRTPRATGSRSRARTPRRRGAARSAPSASRSVIVTHAP